MTLIKLRVTYAHTKLREKFYTKEAINQLSLSNA